MARARNIKPSFFTNEQLSENCPLGRLLFVGLWTLADYKGDLEWKERTIKIQLLPWDDCNVKELAIKLDNSGLVRFYSDGDKTYLHVINFVKHQNPHKNEKEKGSDIPAYSESMRQVIDLKELTINRDKSGLKRNDSQSDPADSLLLNPYSLNPVSPQSQQVAKQGKPAKKINVDLDYSVWPSIPSEQILNDWLAMRKSKKAAISQTVINQFGKQLRLAINFGFTVDQCISECITRNWTGFNFEWMQNAGVQNATNQRTNGAGRGKEKVSHADRVRAEAKLALQRIDEKNGHDVIHENGGSVREQGGISEFDNLF